MVRHGRWAAVVAALAMATGAAAPARASETLYLTSGNSVWTAPADKLGSPFTTPTAITGLASGSEQVVAIDLRPADQKPYVLTLNLSPNPDLLRLYTLNPIIGTATVIGAAPVPSPAADNTFSYWIDFNPVADRIRVVTGDNKSFRMNPNTGEIVNVDTALAFAPGDATSGTPAIRGVSYDNSVAGATSTTAYAWHLPVAFGASIPTLRLGGPGGTPSANSGQLSTIGPTGVTVGGGTPQGLHVSGLTGTAYAGLLQSNGLTTDTTIGTINLTTGAYTTSPSFSVYGMTDFTVGPGAALGLAAATVSQPEAGGNATITVTRSGSTAGVAKVDYATTDGSATAGSDYTATSGTLTFADGETSKTFTVPVADDTADEGRESFTVELSNPVGNVAAGAVVGRRLATVMIEDNDAPPVVTPTPTPTPTPDTTKPTVTLTGVPASLTRAKFLRGFTITLFPSEPATFDVTLEGKTHKATLASVKTTLFSKHLKLAATSQTLKVTPNRKGVGKVRKTRKVTLRVVVTDAANNRRTTTKTIKVKPDPKKKH